MTVWQNGANNIYFKLNEDFLTQYDGKQPNWGYGGLGYITYKRTYARKLDNGKTEEYWQTLKRVVEGVYTVQKRHCYTNQVPWSERKAQTSAQKMFQLMWDFKFTPPGRGFWMMGTEYMYDRGGAPLNNCAFVSTENITLNFAEPFCFLMDMSMLGVGVGGDTKGAGKLTIRQPKLSTEKFVMPDTREGWVEGLRMTLSAFSGEGELQEIDYSLIRPYGALIKGFGGTASGPDPLREALQDITTLLTSRIGEKITSTDIVDIFNLVGRCVVAGNVRRTAEIMFGDPNDEQFITMKDPEKYSKELLSHRWASNNSIFGKVGMDYSKVAELTAKNGEPGYEFLDNAKAYSRMGREPDNKDYRAMGGNPSMIGTTRVLTTKGIYEIKNLEGKTFEVQNINGEKQKATCRLSGKNKQLYEVKLSNGFSYFCTPEHHWIIDGKNKQTTQLKKGDVLPTTFNFNLRTDGKWDYEDGFLVGWNLGDGWIYTTKENKKGVGFIVSQDDKKDVLDKLKDKLFNITNYRYSFYKRKREGKPWYEMSTTRHSLFEFFKDKGIINKSFGIPKKIFEEASDSFIKGLVDGLYSSDGGVDKSSNRLIYTSKDKKLIDSLRDLLGFYGIYGTVHKTKRPSVFPNKKDYKKEYTSYSFRICGENLEHFKKVFILTNKKKQKQLDDIKIKTRNYKLKIESVTKLKRREDVWDISVYDDTHSFRVSHGITGNCLEQTLEPYELCCLVETYPSNHESLKDWLETLKYAYLYAKTVTLIPTHNKLTNAVMLRNRRIGCSVSGFTQACTKFGRRNMMNNLDVGYTKIQDWDKTFSEWLCIPRSIKTTSVKPSGTVSLLAGVTPGMHYPISQYYIRNVRFMSDSPMLNKLLKAGYEMEPDVYSKNTMVVSFPVEEKFYDRSVSDVSMWEQMENLAQVQEHWADNQVSVTISFKKDEAKDIKNVLELYETRIKGVSFLPQSEHGYKQAPYIPISKEQYEEMSSKIKKVSINEWVHDSEEKYCDGATCQVEIK